MYVVGNWGNQVFSESPGITKISLAFEKNAVIFENAKIFPEIFFRFYSTMK
jgi:hypothetical protein